MENTTADSTFGTERETPAPPTPVPGSPKQHARDPLKQQQAVVAMGRRAIAPPDLAILMQDGAALLAETLDVQYSAVAELSSDGRSLRVQLMTSEEDDETPLRTATHETSAAGIDSLAGYVLEVAHPVVVADLPREKRFHDHFLRKHGIRSAIAVPLKLQDRSFGSLAACSTRKCDFDDDDVLFVETIAHLVATTIARKKAETSLAEERLLANGVLETVEALVLVLDPQWQIVRVNRVCRQVTGFSLAEIRNRPVWNVFPVPEEVEMFQRILARLRKNESPVGYESYLLTKHSERRRIAWSYSATTGADGELESIIATGIDITEQREAEQRAQRAEQAAEEARIAMAAMATADLPSSLGDQAAPSADDRQLGSAFGRLPIPLNAERRKRPRRAYPYRQMIAPVIDGKLPDRNRFAEVQCHDIAAGGFSYFSSEPPRADTVVVALGIRPKVTYLTAQVAHVTRVEKDGKRVFLIGCNYVGRAKY